MEPEFDAFLSAAWLFLALQVTEIAVAAVDVLPMLAAVRPISDGLAVHDALLVVSGREAELLPIVTVHSNSVPAGKLVPAAGTGVKEKAPDRSASAYFLFVASLFAAT